MDRTLLSESSTWLWIRYLRERREYTRRDVVRLIGILVRYKLGVLDMVALTRKLAREMAGQPEAERIAFTQKWFEDQLVHYVAPEARRRLEAHRQGGHRVAIITASPGYTADALAQHLGLTVEDVLATRFEVRDGQFTGRMIEPMCYGEGKLIMARAYAERLGIDLAASYFYTDGIADRALLERVGYPIAVNPDRRLHRLALQRGWPVVRFY